MLASAGESACLSACSCVLFLFPLRFFSFLFARLVLGDPNDDFIDGTGWDGPEWNDGASALNRAGPGTSASTSLAGRRGGRSERAERLLPCLLRKREIQQHYVDRRTASQTNRTNPSHTELEEA